MVGQTAAAAAEEAAGQAAAQPGGKLQENRATLVCSKRHEKPKCCCSSNSRVAATVAGSGVSSGFSSISRVEDFPTNLNVTCEQISTRSSIHSAPTHTHTQTRTDTATLCGSMTQLLCLQLLALRCCETFHFFCQLATNVQAVSSQWPTCNMQHATGNRQAAEHSMPNVEHQSLVI